MKLYEGRAATANLVRGYDADAVTIGATRHPLPVMLSASLLNDAPDGRSLDTLSARDVESILAAAPNLVLVGSARQSQRVPPPLRAQLESRQIAIEAMELGAACRTFNVLVQEDRQVLALLLP